MRCESNEEAKKNSNNIEEDDLARLKERDLFDAL